MVAFFLPALSLIKTLSQEAHLAKDLLLKHQQTISSIRSIITRDKLNSFQIQLYTNLALPTEMAPTATYLLSEKGTIKEKHQNGFNTKGFSKDDAGYPAIEDLLLVVSRTVLIRGCSAPDHVFLLSDPYFYLFSLKEAYSITSSMAWSQF